MNPSSANMPRHGLLLVNLGTPDSPAAGDVRRYLREFLSDPRVIDIPAFARWLLLNLIILPLRPRRSAAAYAKIWTEAGSPLLVHGLRLREKLQRRLREEEVVELGMRYGNPSIASALERFAQRGIEDVAVLVLFPQYSEAAFGSAVAKVEVENTRRSRPLRLSFIEPFFDHPAFIRSFVSMGRGELDLHPPDRVLFSYHGLPERQVLSAEPPPGGHCLKSADCCDQLTDVNRNCYRAQCFATSRALARELGLEPGQCETSFQSRLGRDRWIAPHTDVRIRELAHAGVQRLAVFCPAFVADCLETLEEIGIRAKEDFEAHGGVELQLVRSLNSEDHWVEAIVTLLTEHRSESVASTLPPSRTEP